MLKLGIVDFDSSHCVEFTRRLNHFVIDKEQWVEGAKIVLGCPGESKLSPERIPGFTKTMKELGVELVDFVRLELGVGHLLFHRGQFHHALAIRRAGTVERHVVTQKARDDRRVHGISDARLLGVREAIHAAAEMR